ncbi:hypothetical protein, partial [Phocaeicola coprophilus]|uniref:hypothetical protein n=1 Tax=Phocaeicola coprophilus TaxID=387090 RepID=UPI003AB77D38
MAKIIVFQFFHLKYRQLFIHLSIYFVYFVVNHQKGINMAKKKKEKKGGQRMNKKDLVDLIISY